MTTKNIPKKIISFILILSLCVQICGCSLSSFTDKVSETFSSVKNAVTQWYEGIDLSCFKQGWDSAIEYMGNAYSAVVTNEYVTQVGEAINTLKTDINSAYGSARGIAQEAGFAAEKWVTDTFNIDSAVRQSSYHAETVGSNELGSVDVKTNYGEEASLKYYQDANASANAQAKTILARYNEYCSSSKNPMSLDEYINKNGFKVDEYNDLLKGLYDGQTRIIPADQLNNAKAYLSGKASELESLGTTKGDAKAQTYVETLNNLKDRLSAPDGTASKPVSYEEMQAITELSQSGEFKPEDFGLSLSQVITPKYIVKQAIGTGLEAGLLRTVFEVGPDLVSIIIEAVKNKNIDEAALKETSIEGAIAMSEGFVEGSLSGVVVNLCKKGILGETLKEASPNVVGAFVFLAIEALISGYSLAKGEITADEYGWLMADKTMVTALAIPTTAAILSILPGTKLFMLAGCFAGGVIASTGYTVAKELTLEFINGNGFEAIVSSDIGQNISNAISSAKETISNINIKEQLSNLKDYTVTTLSNGLVKLKGVFN